MMMIMIILDIDSVTHCQWVTVTLTPWRLNRQSLTLWGPIKGGVSVGCRPNFCAMSRVDLKMGLSVLGWSGVSSVGVPNLTLESECQCRATLVLPLNKICDSISIALGWMSLSGGWKKWYSQGCHILEKILEFNTDPWNPWKVLEFLSEFWNILEKSLNFENHPWNP